MPEKITAKIIRPLIKVSMRGSIGQTYTAGSGLILTGNEFSVNPDLVLTSVEADDVTVHDSATFDFISGNRIPYGSFFNTNANFHFTSLVLHTPNLTVNNQLEIQGTTISMKSVGGIRGRQRFYETDTNGLNYVELIAPDSLSQTFELILPADVPSAGQVLAVASWSNPVITTEWITVGSGTVNSGLSGRLTYYPSNGTTVDDASDLSYDSGTSTLTVNGIVAIGSSGQIEDDGGGNLQITSNDILKIIGSTRTEVTGRIDVYDGLRSMGGDTGTRTILETNDSGQDAVHLYRYSTTQTSQFHYYDDDNLYSIALRAQATFPTSSSRVIELPANTGSVNDVLKISAINGNVYTTEWSAGGGGGLDISELFSISGKYPYPTTDEIIAQVALRSRVIWYNPAFSNSVQHIGCPGANSGTPSGQAFVNLNWSRLSSSTGTPSISSQSGNGQFFLARGLYYFDVVYYPDASYNEAGASTGTRISSGMVSTGTSNWFTSDDPAGSRICFVRRHTNGGAQDTNWKLSVKDGTTENLIDTGMAFVAQNIYVRTFGISAGGTTLTWKIWNVTAGGAAASGTTTSNLPAGTTALYAGDWIYSVNSTTRRLQFLVHYAESGFIDLT